MKEDFIYIKVSGPRKVRQEVIDKVYGLIMDDEFLDDVNEKKGAFIRIESSIEVSQEVIHG
jgi:hypothetical protein